MIQKVIKYLKIIKNQRNIKIIKENFLKICMNQYGTRVFQKLIDKIQNDSELIYLFNHILLKYFIELILDSNSTHIIINSFSSIKSYDDIFINIINKNIFIIWINKYSCYNTL